MSAVVGIDIREVGEVADLRAIERLLAGIWRTQEDRPPISSEILRAMAHAGCYVAGAYEGDRLVGASVGFLGGARQDLHLHSHITGVDAEAQGRHVGYALKLHQRQWCLDRGIDVVTWTFDPLVRRNAWFNLHRLGADIVEFHHDFYGEMSDGLNVGDNSDRCVVRWDLPGATARDAIAPDAGARVIDLPADFDALRRDDPAQAREWRRTVRAKLTAAFDDGLHVAGMTAAGQYVLT